MVQKSCTSWYVVNPIIYKVLYYLPGGLPDFFHATVLLFRVGVPKKGQFEVFSESP